MSLKTLETEILAQVRVFAGNSKLRKKDLLEWSTGDIKAQEGEKLIRLPSMGINVCIPEDAYKK